MRLLRISLEKLSVMCEIQIKQITLQCYSFRPSPAFDWVKLDYRKVKFLTIDFTGGVIF